MRHKKHLTNCLPLLLLFAFLLVPSEARAEHVVITSGFVSIDATQRGNVTYDFAGAGLSLTGTAERPNARTGCFAGMASPCVAGSSVTANSSPTLSNFPLATAIINGVTYSVVPSGGFNFTSPAVTIPGGNAPTIILETPFIMTGELLLRQPSLNLTFSYTLSGEGIARITLALINGGYVAQNVRYDFQPSAVPEPATMILLGTGLAGLAARTRRRRRNN